MAKRAVRTGRGPGVSGANKVGVIHLAMPASNQVRTRLDSRGTPRYVHPNFMFLTPAMLKSLMDQGQSYWHPHAQFPSISNTQWIVNMCADADDYEPALKDLAQRIAQRDLAVFNDPTCVLNTRRDRISSTLQGIEGLIVPRCTRFCPTTPDDFVAHFKAADHRFPVLLRPAASQSGQGLVRVDGPEDWGAIHGMPWQGRAVYMTDFVDFQSDDGAFVKTRIVLAGGRISIRHVLFADNWLIHAADRTPKDVEIELARMQLDPCWQMAHQVAQEINRRVGLDFFAIDLGVRDDETFVFFEANAAMSILSHAHMPRIRTSEYLRNMKRIEADVTAAFAAKGINLLG